jgi:hypothetical protein
MYLDTNGFGPGEPAGRRSPPPRLTRQNEKTLLWIAAANVVILIVAPVGGATLFEAVFRLFW